MGKTMTTEQRENVGEMLKFFREHGVRRAVIQDTGKLLEVEFFPTSQQQADEAEATTTPPPQHPDVPPAWQRAVDIMRYGKVRTDGDGEG